ncbi:aspartic peptidase domain-containing protein [Polychytrium aggregatum]|uniref:aspartic peptidase domain-containing protein n=1 Tax=Polychytrium aggregatum TaxID=110093 RepID=UPI0022FE3986|nr:aspartic peptidase domain-containing protein [Polychytrium aggregatum]KAI9206938.1 aspartic peptidase domain-containing protein [Polychytrium aggregatum]
MFLKHPRDSSGVAAVPIKRASTSDAPLADRIHARHQRLLARLVARQNHSPDPSQPETNTDTDTDTETQTESKHSPVIFAASGPIGQGINYDADLGYLISVSLGTPSQQFNVILDTGSANFWVTGTGCNPTSPAGNVFDPTKSSSFNQVPNGNSITVSFGSGTLSGYLAQDTFTGVGASVSPQSVVVANQLDSNLVSMMTSGATKWDGVWGLAFPGLTTATTSGIRQVPPFWNMRSSFANASFAIWLDAIGTSSSSGGGGGGEFVVGGCNPNHFMGTMQCLQVLPPTLSAQPDHWRVLMSAITLGSSSITIPSGSNFAILDSGAPVIGLPQAIYTSVWSSLSSITGGQSRIDCGIASSLPDLTFSLGSQNATFTLKGSDYVYPSGGSCVVGLLNNGNFATVVLGDTFLRKFYSVYDSTNLQIGLATSAQGSALAAGATAAACSCGSVGTGQAPSANTLSSSVIGGGTNAIKLGSVYMNLYLFIGIIVGSVLLLIGIIVGVVLYSRRGKRRRPVGPRTPMPLPPGKGQRGGNGNGNGNGNLDRSNSRGNNANLSRNNSRGNNTNLDRSNSNNNGNNGRPKYPPNGSSGSNGASRPGVNRPVESRSRASPSPHRQERPSARSPSAGSRQPLNRSNSGRSQNGPDRSQGSNNGGNRGRNDYPQTRRDNGQGGRR